jgi:hypothetical protein
LADVIQQRTNPGRRHPGDAEADRCSPRDPAPADAADNTSGSGQPDDNEAAGHRIAGVLARDHDERRHRQNRASATDSAEDESDQQADEDQARDTHRPKQLTPGP